MIRWIVAALLVATPALAQQREDTHFRPVEGGMQALAFTSASMRSFLVGGLLHSVTDKTTGKAQNQYNQHVQTVRLLCTEDCFISIGASNETLNAPEASSTSGMFLPADTIEYFGIRSGEVVSAIRSSTSGTIYIQEMTK